MNLDKTFCASPDCKNECGRQWTKEHEAAATRCGKTRISMAYFCGEAKIRTEQWSNGLKGRTYARASG